MAASCAAGATLASALDVRKWRRLATFHKFHAVGAYSLRLAQQVAVEAFTTRCCIARWRLPQR